MDGARPDAAGADRQPALLVRAAGRLCAVPIAHVVEVMRALPVEPIPGAPSFVPGLAIIRGAPMPVVDLGLLTGGRSASGRLRSAGKTATNGTMWRWCTIRPLRHSST